MRPGDMFRVWSHYSDADAFSSTEVDNYVYAFSLRAGEIGIVLLPSKPGDFMRVLLRGQSVLIRPDAVEVIG